jgi:hypothetical protein
VWQEFVAAALENQRDVVVAAGHGAHVVDAVGADDPREVPVAAVRVAR